MIDSSEGDAAHRRRQARRTWTRCSRCARPWSCRRIRLLAYFGQEAEPCGNCDTCLAPPESWDGTVAAQKLLSAVYRLQQRAPAVASAPGRSIDILLGRKTAKVIQHDHDALTVFGVGTDLREQEWRGVLRQLLAQGLLAVEGDHGTLVLTDTSGDVLGKRRDVPMRREPERVAKSSSSASSAAAKKAVIELSPEAEPVFQRLRAWRAATAREQGVPAYVIFHDATLRQIAGLGPKSLAELGKVNGVGENKLAKYGQQILDAL